MNEQAIIDSYNLFVQNGYKKSLQDYKQLISSNPDALNDSYGLFRQNGYAKSLDDYKTSAPQAPALLDAIIDKVLEVNQKRIDSAQKQVEQSDKKIDEQRSRAEQGLSNTLAFEQRELGKREAELVKRQKRQERLEKIKAIYSSYNNYASQGDTNPILKALRDFAILESITASFGDGGVVEDKLPTNGIFKGQSHNGNGGGIPILVEGKEGIFSAREMDNLGKDNFYKMKGWNLLCKSSE